MANNSNAIGQFTDEMEQAVEEVGRDVKDSVGQMIEQNVQTAIGPNPTPQQLQQKQQEEQNKIANARRVIAFYKKTEDELKTVRDKKKQEELQRKQFEEQEMQRKRAQEDSKKKKIISPAKKKPLAPGQPAPVQEEIARTRQETGKGHGVGG